MKTITTFILLSVAISSSAQRTGLKTAVNSENTIIQQGATEEEYLYMTKGYKTQIENGLDTKKGYEISKPRKIELTNYVFDYHQLIRTSDNYSVGLIVKATSKVWGNTYYFGIPNGNDELLHKAFEEINKLDEAMTTAFFYSYCKLNTN